MVLARVIIFQVFPTWSGKGLSRGTFWKKWSQEKHLIRYMWLCDGPGKGHHFSNLSQHGLGRGCLGDQFAKNEAKRKTWSGIYSFLMVPARVIIFPTFPNMVWEGIVLGTILEEMKPREKPYQEYVDLWWSWQGSSFPQLFPTWSGKGLSSGPFRKKRSQEKNLIMNMWICDGPGKGHNILTFPNMVW